MNKTIQFLAIKTTKIMVNQYTELDRQTDRQTDKQTSNAYKIDVCQNIYNKKKIVIQSFRK